LPTADGGYLVGGTYDEFTSPRHYDVLKIDSDGIRQWKRGYTGIGNSYLYSIIRSIEGGYLLLGGSRAMSNVDRGGDKSAPDYGQTDFWVVSIDELGAKRWDNSYGGTGEDWAVAAVVQTADGGYVIGGTSSSWPSGNKSAPNYGSAAYPSADYWLVRIGAQGQILWDRSFGGRDGEGLRGIAPTADGGLLLAGGSASKADGTKTVPSFGESDFYVVKVDSQGRQQWDRAYGGSASEVCEAFVASPGVYVLAGRSTSPPGPGRTAPLRGYGEFWVVAIEENGNKLWDQSYGGDSYEYLRAAIATPDGGFLLAGSSNSPRRVSTSLCLAINDLMEWTLRR